MASNKLIATILVLNYVAISPSFGDLDCYDFQGLFAPVFTPVDSGGVNLTLYIIPQYAQFLADYHVKGVLVTGTSGEGATLSVAQEKSIILAWLAVAGPLNLKVIVQIGGRPLPDILRLARFCERNGVDAIMTVPELYFKPFTVDRLVYNLECIAEAAPNTPLLYYDIPEITDVDVDMVEFTIQAAERIPSFIGLKEDNFESALQVQTVIEKYNLVIFIADSLYLAPAVFMGFTNFITTEINLFPQLFNDIIENGQSCNLYKARSQYERLMTLSNIIQNIQSPVDPIPAFKAAMPLVTGVEVGPGRPPQFALTEAERIQLEKLLIDNGVDIIDRDYSTRTIKIQIKN